MFWHLKVQNPTTDGHTKSISKHIAADTLTQAIRRSAEWISTDFSSFTLTRIT